MQAVQAGSHLLSTCLSAGQLSSGRHLHRALCLLARMHSSIETEQLSRFSGPYTCMARHAQLLCPLFLLTAAVSF